MQLLSDECTIILYQLFNLSNSIIPFVDFQFNKQSIKSNQINQPKVEHNFFYSHVPLGKDIVPGA